MTESREPDLSTVASPPRRPDIEYSTVTDGKLVGSGGQAIVRRATLPGSEPPDTVAVKEPQAPTETLPPDTIESFFEEARTWRKLDTRERTHQFHDTDHIVGIVAIGDELPWVAMEYMDGGSLADRLEAHPDGLPVDEALWIAKSLCRGVKHAHDNGVAHLDLKPANVLFRETPGDTWNVPKIADWGLARALLDDSRSMKAFSVGYAAPEQFDADSFGKPDTYTDIYQVGAIIYELLTGRPPYTGGQASVMHDVVYGDDPEPPSSRREAISEAVDDIVLRALNTEKPQRYRGSIDRLEDAIRDIRQGDTTVPSRNSTSRQTAAESTDTRHKRTATGPNTTAHWPMFQGGPARTGYRPNTIGPREQTTVRWSYRADSKVSSSPAVANGTVYVGSWDRNVYALDAETGRERWSYAINDWVDSSPAVADGTVYVGSDDGTLYALDAETGSERWSYTTEDAIESSPVVADGDVYVGSKDETLYALDAETGRERWSYTTDGPVMSSPAVADGTVYVGSVDDHVYALDAETGHERWSYATDGSVESSPAVVDGTVYVGSWDDHVYALDAETGRECWRYATSVWIKSSPAVAHGTVYVGSDDETLYALDAETGREHWTYSTDGFVTSSPAVTDDIVYVGSNDGTLYALDAETGRERWTYATDDEIASSPAVVDGTVYVGSKDHHVYALMEQ